MSRKTVPAQQLILCDCCDKNNHETTFKRDGSMRVTYHQLDYANHPVAQFDTTYDFCDKCLPRIVKAINATVAEIRGVE